MSTFGMFDRRFSARNEVRHGVDYVVIDGPDVRVQARVSDWTSAYGEFADLTSDQIKRLHVRAVKSLPAKGVAPKTRAERVLGKELMSALQF